MTEVTFCAASVLLLVWIIFLKVEIDRLKGELGELKVRLSRHKQQVKKAKKAKETRSGTPKPLAGPLPG
jgi:hypothetical protein